MIDCDNGSDIDSGTRFSMLREIRSCVHPQFSSLLMRALPSSPLLDRVPNGDSLYEDLRRRVDAVGTVSLDLVSTQKAERVVESSPRGSVVVVVSSYNCEQYVVETMQSIAMQSHKEILIAIVDDGSEDGTVDRLQQFMNAHSEALSILLLRIPHVGNAALTRNICLANLIPDNFDFIAFMDGDDLYATSNAVSVLVDALSADRKRIAAFGDYDWISEDGRVVGRPSGIRKSLDGRWRWRKRRLLTWKNLAVGNIGVFHLQCLMVRRRAPYLPYRPRGEDTEYYGMLLRLGNGDETLDWITQIPELVAHYRKHLGSLSNKPAERSYSEREIVRREVGGVAVPRFFDWANIPDKYLTRENISQWLTRRAARQIIRHLFRGALGDALQVMRAAWSDGQLMKRHLLTIPTLELFADPSTRQTLAGIFQRLVRRSNA